MAYNYYDYKKAKNDPKAPFQLNGYKIKWSKTYERWQVCKGKVILESFRHKDKAREFAKNN